MLLAPVCGHFYIGMAKRDLAEAVDSCRQNQRAQKLGKMPEHRIGEASSLKAHRENRSLKYQ
ncbi:hypothetical protein NTCA1_42980 [Novosphingobium sp. TCA1]|nr:hypothetical protein NTCA1_42980 [Novosphingobium sp. TCA1]